MPTRALWFRRQCLEYAMAVWASIGDKKNSRSWMMCRFIVFHGSLERNLTLLCNREFIRIMSEDVSHPVRESMNSTTRSGLQFCPIKYIQTMSRELQRGFKDCEIETRNIIIRAVLFDYFSSRLVVDYRVH